MRTARHETGRREVNISKNVSVSGLILNLYYFDTIWRLSSSCEYFVFNRLIKYPGTIYIAGPRLCLSIRKEGTILMPGIGIKS